nr:hypothetical protein [Tanacetum cinerariifolium]
MVLSLLAQMPPTRHYSRDVLEEMDALVDELATMVDTFCSSTAVFEAISQQLPVQTTITKNESNDHTFNTTTDICETKTDVITETSSLVTKSNKPDNTMIKLLADSTVENEVFTQIPFFPVSGC